MPPTCVWFEVLSCFRLLSFSFIWEGLRTRQLHARFKTSYIFQDIRVFLFFRRQFFSQVSQWKCSSFGNQCVHFWKCYISQMKLSKVQVLLVQLYSYIVWSDYIYKMLSQWIRLGYGSCLMKRNCWLLIPSDYIHEPQTHISNIELICFMAHAGTI